MKSLKVALIGNPNCGKSTLFNVLTGSAQTVGNWPGVTVERKSGYLEQGNCSIEIVDLPGVYSLVTATADTAIDTKIACEAINSAEMDLIVNIIDASNLERHLYLTTQLLEMQVPMIVAVNMLDVIEKRGMRIDLDALSKQLGCPVVGLSASQKTGIQQLKKALIPPQKTQSLSVHYPPALNQAVDTITHLIQAENSTLKASRFLSLSWLEGGHQFAAHEVSVETLALMQQQRHTLETTLKEESDLLIADTRYTIAHQIAEKTVQKTAQNIGKTLTQRIDKIILHRIWGIPIFLAAMYLMFFFSINVGHAFQPFFDQGSEAIFVDGLAQLLTVLHMPATITALLTLGIGKGINTVVTFIPLLGCLFLCLSFLESSGYMARAAFVVDRVMRAMGLPGKSFVPLIVGFGCNVPAILAARTLENRRDRLLTLMMTPFMSCGARLAIYAVFTTAFFPKGGQNIVFMLYMIGILMAVMTGLVLRKTVLKGESAPWLVELPAYHFPTAGVLLRSTWHRLKTFIINAGRYIIPVCFLLGALNAFTIDGHLAPEPDKGSSNSVLSVVGKAMTPIFAPMGIVEENWPATVGLVSGVLAKEVVVGTLNTLYTQVGNLSAEPDAPFDFILAMKKAVLTIPHELGELKNSLGNPIAAAGGLDEPVNDSVLGMMAHYFDGQVGAMAYLLFVLLYFPCISATAALARESSRNWAVFSVLWTTGLAYMVAVIFYQAATFAKHPISSANWVIGLTLLLASVLWGIKRYARESTDKLSSVST
jgi:ferrous iron transport protein B